MERHALLVLGRAAPGREDEFFAWYDKEHIPEALAQPGMIRGARFDVRWVQGAEALPQWQYATIFEVDAEDPEAAIANMRAAVRDGQIAMADAVDRSSLAIMSLGRATD